MTLLECIGLMVPVLGFLVLDSHHESGVYHTICKLTQEPCSSQVEAPCHLIAPTIATYPFFPSQYIQLDLKADGLTFRNPLYNQVLEEAVAHSGDGGFVASEFFSRHHDIKVSALAAEMLLDPVQLTKSLQPKEEEETLRQEVEHLVLDFRMDYVNAHIQVLRQQIAANDPERLPQQMEELKTMMELRNLMAKKLGTSIIT